MDISAHFGTLPPGARILPLEKAALGALDVAPRTLARWCEAGKVLAARRPGKTDRRGVKHGRWLVAVRDNGLPIFKVEEPMRSRNRRSRRAARRQQNG